MRHVADVLCLLISMGCMMRLEMHHTDLTVPQAFESDICIGMGISFHIRPLNSVPKVIGSASLDALDILTRGST